MNQISGKKVWVKRWRDITNLAMYPPWGPSPFLSSITRWGWLLTTLPSSFPFHVPSSSLNDADLNTKHLVQYCFSNIHIHCNRRTFFYQSCRVHECYSPPLLLKNTYANPMLLHHVSQITQINVLNVCLNGWT